MFYLRQKKILINLIVMSICWLVSSLNYYLLTFLVNTFENVYTTALFSSCSAFLAYIVAACL